MGVGLHHVRRERATCGTRSQGRANAPRKRAEELATIRRNRVAELARQGPAATAALAEALNDENAGVRMAAARALGEMGPQAQAALPALERRLKLRAATVSLEASICLLAMQKIAPQWR